MGSYHGAVHPASPQRGLFLLAFLQAGRLSPTPSASRMPTISRPPGPTRFTSLMANCTEVAARRLLATGSTRNRRLEAPRLRVEDLRPSTWFLRSERVRTCAVRNFGNLTLKK